MYQFKRILKTDLLNLFKNPQWWFYSIGLPLLLALILGFLTSSSYGNEVTAYSYYGVTIMVFGALNTATLAANSFMETRLVKANMRLCTAPVPSFSIYFPKILASFIFSAFCHSLAGFALFLIAGVNFGGVSSVFLWFLLLAVDLFAASLGIMLCCLLKNEEAVNQLLSILVTIACLLGGAFFPLKGLGRVVDIITNISPVTWINAAAFDAVYGESLQILGCVCAALVVLSAVWIGISSKCFNKEDYL